MKHLSLGMFVIIKVLETCRELIQNIHLKKKTHIGIEKENIFYNQQNSISKKLYLVLKVRMPVIEYTLFTDKLPF